MRKLAPARVSYRDDFLIWYRLYMMTGSFHLSLFEGTLHADKIHVWFKSQTLRKSYPFQSTGRPISNRNRWSIDVYMILLRDFRTEVKFSPLYSNRGELTPGWLSPAWHFLLVSCKRKKSHEREPEGTCAGAEVATASCKHLLRGYMGLSVSRQMA